MIELKEQEVMSWRKFDNACRRVANIVKEKKMIVNSIYGIPRGGLVIAVRLSHLLGLPVIVDVTKISPYTLIVDDILDSGSTLEPYFKSGYFCATLYLAQRSMFEPQIWIHRRKAAWVVFPWEVR